RACVTPRARVSDLPRRAGAWPAPAGGESGGCSATPRKILAALVSALGDQRRLEAHAALGVDDPHLEPVRRHAELAEVVVAALAEQPRWLERVVQDPGLPGTGRERPGDQLVEDEPRLRRVADHLG